MRFELCHVVFSSLEHVNAFVKGSRYVNLPPRTRSMCNTGRFAGPELCQGCRYSCQAPSSPKHVPSLRAMHVCSPSGKAGTTLLGLDSRLTRAVNNRTWRLHVVLHLEMEYLGLKVMDRPWLIEPYLKQFDRACITVLRQTDISWFKVSELRP